jgi:tagatose 6-phosphate kinase
VILTVTLNPALDVTYRVDDVVLGRTHRVRDVTTCAGGKGLNVARVLASAGFPVRATGLLGGRAGEHIRALLHSDGVVGDFVPIAAEARHTIVLVDGHTPTGFWEPGPVVTPAEWRAFIDTFPRLLSGARVVVLSGSLPPSVPDDAYATLIAIAHEAGTSVVLDADGEALRLGVRAGPAVVKPNQSELATVTGRDVTTAGLAVAAARELRRGLPTAVVATLGADGLVSSTRDGDLTARLSTPLTGNTTGAGDACAAALAAGLLKAQEWEEIMSDAVAYSAAAVTAPVAGVVDPRQVQRLRSAVVVERL